MKRLAYLTLIFTLLTISLSMAVPLNLPVEGQLFNNSDNSTLSGSYDFTFRIFNASTGGTNLFEQNSTLTLDLNGFYSVLLENVTLSFNEDYYVETLIEGETLDRIEVGSVPYTHLAGSLIATNGTQTIAIINHTTVSFPGIAGLQNNVIGDLAGNSMTSETAYNTLIGDAAGRDLASNYSTMIGWYAGYRSTGNGNTVLGANALTTVTTGINNVVVGRSANLDSDFSYATIVGANSKAYAAGSVAIGYEAESADGVSIGYQAGANQDTASVDNVIIGWEAGNSFGGYGGDDNVIIGDEAGQSLRSASNNIVIGADSDVAATSINNTVIGYAATCNYNNSIALGAGATCTGNDQAVLGVESALLNGSLVCTPANGLCNQSSSGGFTNNTPITTGDLLVNGTLTVQNKTGTILMNGSDTWINFPGIGGTGENLILGVGAGGSQTSSDVNNVFLGAYAGRNSDATSVDGTYVGYQAGYNIGNSDGNTLIGARAGDSIINSGHYNVIIGEDADTNSGGDFSVVIGSDAFSTSSSAVVIGDDAEGGLTSISIGKLAKNYGSSVSIGDRAGTSLSSSSDDANNVFVGSYAGAYVGNSVTSTDNTCLGDYSCNTLVSGDYNVVVGSASDVGIDSINATSVGYAAVCAYNNSIALGAGATCDSNNQTIISTNCIKLSGGGQVCANSTCVYGISPDGGTTSNIACN